MKVDAKPDQGNHHHAEQCGALRYSPKPAQTVFEPRIRSHAILRRKDPARLVTRGYLRLISGTRALLCMVTYLMQWGDCVRLRTHRRARRMVIFRLPFPPKS